MEKNKLTDSNFLRSFTEQYRLSHDSQQILELLMAALYIDAVNAKDLKAPHDPLLYSRATTTLNKEREQETETDPLEMVLAAKLSSEKRAEIAAHSIVVLGQGRSFAGKNTPKGLTDAICGLLKPTAGSSFLDFGSGTGLILFSMYNYGISNQIQELKLQGIEPNEGLAFISEVLMELQGGSANIATENGLLRTADEKKYDMAYVFPPLGMRCSDSLRDSFNDEFGNIFKGTSYSGWYFIFRALKLVPNGRLVALLPEGALFRITDEGIRKYLVDNKIIEGLILLPQNIIDSVGSRLYLLVLNNSNENSSFKMVDASECVIPSKVRTRTACIDSQKILDAYYAESADTYTFSDAAQRDYCLNLSAYKTIDVIKSIDCPAKISEISTVIVGSQYTISHFEPYFSDSETDYQLLSPGNIEDGMIPYDSLQYINPSEKIQKLSKFALQENDLVITTKSTVVKTAVVKGISNRHIIVTGGMLIVRPDLRIIDPIYLKMFFDSEIGRTVLRSIQKGTIVTTIPTSAFKNLDVACPPLEKQKSLARRYSALLSMYEALRKQADAIKTQIFTFYDDSVQEG